MRRSAAPSQQTAAKRARFISPVFRVSEESGRKERTTTDVLNLIKHTSSKAVREKKEVPEIHSSVPISITDPANTVIVNNSLTLEKADLQSTASTSLQEDQEQWIALHEGKENLDNITSVFHEDVPPHIKSTEKYQPCFKPCKSTLLTKKEQVSTHKELEGLATAQAGRVPLVADKDYSKDEQFGPRNCYYSVVWCKLSKKKHKTWQNDAILMTKGREAILLDTDGKEIGRSSGYKIKELETLEVGHHLVIGGKEIEVINVLSEEDYKTGRCFTGSSVPVTVDHQPGLAMNATKPNIKKPFKKPQKVGQRSEGLQDPVVHEVKPRFDINLPNALVMPKPSQFHEWEYNLDKLPVVDVVVDPYLTQHLRPHQRSGVVFLYECVMGMKNFTGKGAILADEMGLGKTLQCITLIWTLLKQGPYGGKPVIKRVLIITPGSLVKNWLKEFKKWLGAERLKVFAVSQSTRIEDYACSPNIPVLIISYEMFVRSIEVIQSLNFDLIICDEGHRLKNTSIKTTTLVNSLSSRRRIILTGTPVQNDLQELFSIVDFCNPGVLGTSSAFRHVFEEPIVASSRPGASDEEKLLGQTRAAELNKITSMFILRRTSDINNSYLPPKVDMVLFCQLSALQLKLYQKLLTSQAVKSCLCTLNVAQHLTCISALRKLCNHPILLYNKAKEVETSHCVDTTVGETTESDLYKGLHAVYPECYDSETLEIMDSGKLSVLANLLAAFHRATPQERVVIVSNYTKTLDIIEDLSRSCNYQWLRLDGQTPVAKRQQLVERFNNHYSNDFLFLLSSKAGGTGLNLIGASRLILYDIDWNPANDLQAMARVWRDGQRRTVYIYRLLTTGTIEEKMYQRQITKQELSGVVVDAKTNNSGNQVQFSQDELRDLFKLEKSAHCTTHDILGCDCQGQDQVKIPEDAQSIEQSERKFQIGQTSKKNQKNLCMNELFDWQHVAGPSPVLDIDPVLSDVDLGNVSFVFYCRSNAPPTSTPV